MGIGNTVGFVRKTLPEVADVDAEGNVTHRQGFSGVFAHRLDLKDFPFDTQVFRIQIVAPGMTAAELQFAPDEEMIELGMKDAAGIAEDITVPDWEVTSWTAGSRPYRITPSVDLAGYAFEFRAQRRSAHYLLKVIIPLLLIVMMSWMVFWIDPENASSKISVSVTSMLTLIAYRFAIGAQVPRIPYSTRLDTFVMSSTVLVFVALVTVTFTTTLARRGREDAAKRIDRWLRGLAPLAFAAATVFTLVA
jgi:hypothetical protein